MKIYSFPRGGFVFEDPTAPQKDNAVNAFLPAVSVIPLGDSAAKVYPVVQMGEIVKEGMLIGRASGPNAVNVHATVPGRVIRKVTWKDSYGINYDALVIRMEGAFEKLGKREDSFLWKGLGGYDIQKIISDLGIVEMENAGRPLSGLISSARSANEKVTLVVRCVFDDPWLAADYALCNERLHAVIEGAAIVAKACFKVTQIIFAVSYHEKELGERFMQEAANWDIQSVLMLTGCRYPQRNNRELELALRKFEKREKQSFGSFLILSPAVLAAAHDAVKHKRPILDRYVAVGGSAVRHPQILKVRIGTRIGELIEQCGGFTEAPYKVATGSPLSGREVTYLDEPVRKNCYAIAAMTKAQASSGKQQNCINCGECRSVCPMGLDPQYIYKRIRTQGIENVGTAGCHGCGCCKIVCPSSLLLSDTIMEGNQETANV
jgi:Na+-translocating ferredoxin:NAD+ oxidoreductase subunit C